MAAWVAVDCASSNTSHANVTQCDFDESCSLFRNFSL